jgi:hypothetical protein
MDLEYSMNRFAILIKRHAENLLSRAIHKCISKIALSSQFVMRIMSESYAGFIFPLSRTYTGQLCEEISSG